jgi:protein nanos 1
MSRSIQSNKPFCKVCKDAGKSESEYTSHYVKNRDGVVTCTTLLSQNCRYCGEAGHTVKFCQVLKKRERESRAPPPPPAKIVVPAAEKPKIFRGGFAALASDSDSEDEAPPKRATLAPRAKLEINPVKQVKQVKFQEDDFPAFASVAPKQQQTAMNYLATASAPRAEPVVRKPFAKSGMVTLSHAEPTAQIDLIAMAIQKAEWEEKQRAAMSLLVRPKTTRNWDDDESDEDEPEPQSVFITVADDDDW